MFLRLAGSLVATYLILANGVAHALKPGDMAPDFRLPGADGKTYQP